MKPKTLHLVEAFMLIDEALNQFVEIDIRYKKSLSRNQLYDWTIAYDHISEAYNYTRKVLLTCKDNPLTSKSDA